MTSGLLGSETDNGDRTRPRENSHHPLQTKISSFDLRIEAYVLTITMIRFAMLYKSKNFNGFAYI
jgi:hypothetical protein